MSKGGSQPGERRGGRKAGTRNRRTDAAIALLESLEYDAITELVAIAREAEAQCDLATRLDVAQTLIRYSYPSLKAIDLAVAGGDAPMKLEVVTGIPADPPKEIPASTQALMDQLAKLIDEMPDD